MEGTNLLIITIGAIILFFLIVSTIYKVTEGIENDYRKNITAFKNKRKMTSSLSRKPLYKK
jgi:hypothetical protein